ncbi:MAG TPA: type II secretion system minor pseudopilin GspK, partial [Candidatus Acidoferrum sp.]|nr:type II secretion system minor pseudopilin GspK [Candidatus Acidoferrum sp.]
MVNRLRKNERGVALLAVLLGIALMTLIVVDFAMSSGLGFVSAANQANELRASYLARSGINIGLGLLAEDARNKLQNATPAETLGDVWAVPFPPMPLEGGTVTLSIIDEGRKLNLNAMVQNGVPNQAAIQKVQRLFTVLDVSPDLVQGIIDWITPNDGTGSGGNIGDYYLALKPPYQPRYGAMPTIADLQLVQGFNEAIFNRVSPFLTVMAETAVNADTASPQVLAALEPQLTEDQKLVVEIIEARTIRPFAQVTDIMNLPDLADVAQLLSKDVDLRSQFFTIIG